MMRLPVMIEAGRMALAPAVESDRVRAAIELACVIAFGLVSKLILDPYLWKFSGPISLIITLGLLTVYMRSRGERWSRIGLQPVPGLRAKLLILPKILLTIVAILGTGMLMHWLGDLLGWWSMDQPMSGIEQRYDSVQGNLLVYLLWIGLSWLSGGFAEEMVFRGFLITWAARVFAGSRASPLIAVLFAALIFAAGHFYYQGIRGALVTGCIGLALGLLYLLFKRNLWPLIFAHALVNSLAFTALYADLDV